MSCLIQQKANQKYENSFKSTFASFMVFKLLVVKGVLNYYMNKFMIQRNRNKTKKVVVYIYK